MSWSHWFKWSDKNINFNDIETPSSVYSFAHANNVKRDSWLSEKRNSDDLIARFPCNGTNRADVWFWFTN